MTRIGSMAAGGAGTEGEKKIRRARSAEAINLPET